MKRFLIIFLVVLIFAGAGFIIINHFKIFRPAKLIPIDRSKIRVEIINCSGVDKQGIRTQDFLRSLGFDVYEVQSGHRTIDKTTVIERVDPEQNNAEAVKTVMINIKKPRFIPFITKRTYPEIQKDIDSLLYLEVTVVLGKDCEKFLPKAKLIY
jgi:hypothetical protein